MKKFLVAFLLIAQAAAAEQPILTKTVLATYADLVAMRSTQNELVTLLAYSTNAPLVSPITYRFKTGPGPANPPLIVAEAGGNGYWYSDALYSGEVDPGLFGVTGNGTTDDTAALQAAVNYAYANNLPKILVRAGSTRIGNVSLTGTLLVGGLSFVGVEGERSILKANSSATMMKFTSVRNVQFKNIWFDGNNQATNILQFDNATQCHVTDSIFYNSLGMGIYYTGVQNYGHDIARNNFVNMQTAGICFDAISAAAIDVDNNVFQSNIYTNTYGVWIRRGAVNIRISNVNVFQGLKNGIYLDGSPTGGQIGNLIDNNYFEVCTDAPIRLGGAQQTMLSVVNNYFYQDATPDKWSVRDSAGTVLYGFKYANNSITSDSGKALSLTNSLVRGWKITPAAADIATDYELPLNVPFVMESPSQRLESLQVTNYTVTLGASQLAFPGDLVPNRIEFSANSNASITISGFTYERTKLTIYNAGTNTLTFSPLAVDIRPATEDTFIYRNAGWRRERLSYLPDYGGTLYGTLNVTNDLNVYNNTLTYGNAVVNGSITTPWNYIASGTYGATNIATYGGKPGAIIGILKDGNYYAFFGTNGVTRFTSAIELVANTNTLAWFAGWTNDPVTGISRMHSMTLNDVRNALNIVTGVAAGNGISVTSSTNISTKLLAGPGITLSTNGSTGEITINNIGTNAPGATNGTSFYVDSIYSTVLNFINSAELDPAASGTNLTVSIVVNSIETNKVSAAFRSFFKDRSTDTGTQLAATISDFADATWAQLTNSLVASNNISFAYDPSNKKLMISSSGSGSATNVPIIAIDGVTTTNLNFADSAELLVTKSGTNVTYELAATAVTNGTYSNPTLTVDAKGRITAISNGAGGTNTTGIWQTIAGVKFVTTNNTAVIGTQIEVDYGKTVYSGIGTNLVTSGSALLSDNQAIYFSLDFTTPLANTNYLVFLDYEGARSPGSSTIYVGDGTDFVGRRTNGVTFAIVSSAGSVSYTASDHPLRVWIVNPNATITASSGSGGSGIAGIQINGSGSSSNAVDGTSLKFTQSGGNFSGYVTNIDATLLTGTIDDARIPAGIARDSEMALLYGALVGANLWTGANNFQGPVTMSNLTVTTMTVGAFTTGNHTNTGTIQTSNLVATATISGTNANLTGTLNVTNLAGSGTITVPTATPLTSNSVAASTEYVDKAVAAATPTTYIARTIGYGATTTLTTTNTWYIPSSTRTFVQATAYDHGSISVPFRVKIVGFDIKLRVSTTSGASNIPCYIRTNNAIDVSVGSYSLLSVGDYMTNVSGLDIKLNAGDNFAFKYMPTNSDSPVVGGWLTYWLQPW